MKCGVLVVQANVAADKANACPDQHGGEWRCKATKQAQVDGTDKSIGVGGDHQGQSQRYGRQPQQDHHRRVDCSVPVLVQRELTTGREEAAFPHNGGDESVGIKWFPRAFCVMRR